MGKKLSPHLVALETSRFGQFARQVAPIPTAALAECLQHQRQKGGRLGEIMAARGLLDREQIIEVLRRQARWVASARSADLLAESFPLPIKFSLCMPCFNEADVVAGCLDTACAILPEFVEEFEVIVVNDGSRDKTGEVVERYSQNEPRVRLINHPQNRGYGAAVTTGMKAAIGDWVCFTDGDGQFSLLDLPQLLTNRFNADVVIGYRHQRADVGMRKLNAWSWNQLIRLVLGVYVRDLDCAFKLFPREIVQQLQMTASGACINAEVMAQCVWGGLSILEVPVGHYPRYGGQPTGANLKVIAKAFRELPQLWKYRSAARLSPPVRNGEATPPRPHSHRDVVNGTHDKATADQAHYRPKSVSLGFKKRKAPQ